MNINTILKLLGLNVGIAAADVILFSEGLVGLSVLSGGPLLQSAAVMAVIASVGGFFLGNYSIVNSSLTTGGRHALNAGKIANYTLDDIAGLLKGNYDEKKDLANEVKQAQSQIKSLRRKEQTIKEIFDLNDISYNVVLDAVSETEQAITRNMKKLLNVIIVWDPKESRLPEKKEVYTEYRAMIESVLKRNDAILAKTDTLLYEITNYIDAKNSGAQDELELETTISTLRQLNGKEF